HAAAGGPSRPGAEAATAWRTHSSGHYVRTLDPLAQQRRQRTPAAVSVEAYSDAAGAGFPPNLADRPVTTREALRAYDPDLYALVDETMAYQGHVDWRVRR